MTNRPVKRVGFSNGDYMADITKAVELDNALGVGAILLRHFTEDHEKMAAKLEKLHGRKAYLKNVKGQFVEVEVPGKVLLLSSPRVESTKAIRYTEWKPVLEEAQQQYAGVIDAEALARDLFHKRCNDPEAVKQYSVDNEDCTFFDDSIKFWNFRDMAGYLRNFTLVNDTGITKPLVYFALEDGTIFGMHIEDVGLPSANILLAGAPKLWIVIPESATLAVLNALNEGNQWSDRFGEHWFSSKAAFVSLEWLEEHGIPYTCILQQVGDVVVTMPGAIHFGYNLGPNIAEAANFMCHEWLEFGYPCSKVSYLLNDDLC